MNNFFDEFLTKTSQKYPVVSCWFCFYLEKLVSVHVFNLKQHDCR